ncbi:MAG: hypothetical protein PUJ51_01990 [Clostridiales bacterium]|uniref:hypothetical protein n=1 Tax=Terrisporobacter sp. TaxID=1965305 RepID=UPI002A5949B8|nr:hypothetical protein [Terrisporobacter sp.]MDD7753263.1 hypothetical protein [Clostridiales bacterium]MDY4134330.1 hypothetical protein [Terrisporobacter sp.]
MHENKKKNVGRPQTEYNKEELEEIINLAKEELDGRIDKLTYNYVTKFNKKIANNKEFVRSNGELFNLYGYNFWAVKDVGRKLIDKAKGSRDIVAVGEAFVIDVSDVRMVVERHYKNKTQLIKRLVKLFEDNKKKAEFYKKEFKKAEEKLNQKDKEIERLEQALITTFYNSYSAHNSLEDVASLSCHQDRIVYDEVKNAFNNDEGRIAEFFKKCTNTEDNERESKKDDNKTDSIVVDLEERERERQLLREQGLC